MRKNLPNYITSIRIAGTLCILFVPLFSALFFVIYTLTGLTDVLDGWIARKTGTSSDLGARLDSIADLLFYAVMLCRLFPILWETLPAEIWYAAGVILLLRLAAYAVAAVKYRRFASLHTYMNKLTGAAVFVVPYVISLPALVPVCWAVCAIGAVASGEELLIHLRRRNYQADTRTIL